MLKKKYPYLIFILLACIIWWSPNFFTPNTYFNIGDSLFPFHIGKAMFSSLFAWQDNMNEGLGFNRTYADGVSLYYYGLMFLLKSAGIPLWICNRLFFLIPTWLLLFVSYYMILAFINGRFRRIGAMIGSIFLATSPPLIFIAPLLHIAVAGMFLSFAGLKRFLDTQKKLYLIIVALGALLMTPMPRYNYIFIVSMIPFLMCWCFFMKKNKIKSGFPKFVKSACITVILIILVNFYTVFPTIFYLFNHHSSELLPSRDMFLNRLDVVNFYKGQTGLLYTLRLIYNNLNSFYYNYFSNRINSLVSFLLVIFIFIPFTFNKKVSRGIYSVLISSLFILGLVAIFGTHFYKLLMKFIPGFWIINNPQYILMPLAMMYSILLVFSSVTLMKEIDKKFSAKKRKILLTLVVIGVSISIIINNGIYFFDKLPYSRKLFVNEELDNIAMGNHLPYFKIPDTYKVLAGLLPDEDRNTRVLVLPFLTDGYMRYSWWPYRTMPDILSSITNFSLAGISCSPSSRLKTIRNLMSNGQYDIAINILNKFGYGYIFFHKDMFDYNYAIGEELEKSIIRLSKSKYAKVIYDNEYFILLKLICNNSEKK